MNKNINNILEGHSWSDDITNDRASTTYQWCGHDTKINYNTVGNLFSPDSFGYTFNNYGFRCDDFSDPDDHQLRVLFLGCSNTQGIGIPAENTWAKHVHNKLEIDLGIKFPYWNLAEGGRGIEYNSRILYRAWPMLKPHVVILLHPPGIRKEIFIDNNPKILAAWWDEKRHGLLLNQAMKMMNTNQMIYDSIGGLSFIKSLCDQHNSLFMWNSSLAKYMHENQTDATNQNYNLEFKSQIRQDILDCHFYPRTKILYSDSSARDMVHPGTAHHEWFAETVYEDILKRIKMWPRNTL